MRITPHIITLTPNNQAKSDSRVPKSISIILTEVLGQFTGFLCQVHGRKFEYQKSYRGVFILAITAQGCPGVIVLTQVKGEGYKVVRLQRKVDTSINLLDDDSPVRGWETP
jgi:hypothetical protein